MFGPDSWIYINFQMYFLRNLFLILYVHKSKTAMSMTSEQECPECSGPIVGRNFLVESIAAVVFSRELSMSNRYDGGNANMATPITMMVMPGDNCRCIVFSADYLKQLNVKPIVSSMKCKDLQQGRCFE